MKKTKDEKRSLDEVQWTSSKAKSVKENMRNEEGKQGIDLCIGNQAGHQSDTKELESATCQIVQATKWHDL